MQYKIKFSRDIPIRNPHRNLNILLKSDTEYLVNGDMFKVLQRLHGSKLIDSEPMTWISTVPIKDMKNLLIYRSGGIGDLLFILPYMSTIKKINPEIKITFATMRQNFGIIQLSNYIDNILEDPIEYSMVAGKFDGIILFDNFIENNPMAEVTNAFELGKDHFEGLERGPMESNITAQPPIGEKIHCAVFYCSSTKIRDLSPAVLFDYIQSLNPEQFRVTIVAPPEHSKNVLDLAQEVNHINPKLELRQLVNPDLEQVIEHLLATDPPHFGLGPDSGLINLLGYHGIPVIGIFGPFNSWLRLAQYKHAIGIDPITNCPYGKDSMGSCFTHQSTSCELAKYKGELYSPCIHLITADHLLKATQFLIKEVYKTIK